MARAVALRARYEFDQTMSAGPIALIGWLAAASVVVIFLAAEFLKFTRIAPDGGHSLGFLEAFWEATMRTIDAGNVGGDNGWDFRLVMLVVTIWGIFVVSALVGLLSAGVQSRLDELRKGRSFVLERDHTIILNWSASIFDIIAELIVAHANDKRFSIVILADKDKVEMEDEIAAKVRIPRHMRIVCRSGDPSDLHDLEIANLEAARSIVVVAPDGPDPDSQNIKTILALVHGPNRRAAPHRIAAEFRLARNAEVVRSVARGEVQTVLADDLISRIIVHSSRQTGLSAVYSELLDFEGSEIYALAEPAIIGKTFGQALSMFETGALIGLCDADGAVRINPPMETPIAEGMLAVLIAEDADSVRRAPEAPAIAAAAIRAPTKPHKDPERTLILGWNRRGATIAHELSRYMAPGSLLAIAADAPDFAASIAELRVEASVQVAHRIVDTCDQAALAALNVLSYDHIIVLAYSDRMSANAADTLTLVTLLHLRQIAERANQRVTVVSEMADIRNRELAQVTHADDFVVSNRLVSLMLSQASENPYISAIFADLLDADGSEIYMRPVENLVDIAQPMDFYTIVEAARRRGETAFGYCRRREETTHDDRNLGGVVLNPAKGEKLAYLPGDFIVVLAQS